MIAFIAAGGAFGAVARHFVAAQVGSLLGHGFPWAILIVNILGSFVLGGLVEIFALAWSPSQEVRALIVVGMLGAFTTFSTFSMDVVLLYERGQIISAALYIGASVAFAVLAFFAAMQIMRAVLS
ncbi:MAG: fluoride efflux transporter CrcB [Alphaproteobacteria bacterium]|nr:fluoride efflux transporter CrcB [Alphaproteobacteria bacterium]